MKVIDLLNKIANGEEVPKKINFCMRNFEYKKDINDYLCIDENFKETGDYCLGISICKWIFPSMLNDEVEILEEEKKIPEKLGYFDLTKDKHEYDENGHEAKLGYTGVADTIDNIYFKINEIIDYLKSKGDE